jgi:hypothetical protein
LVLAIWGCGGPPPPVAPARSEPASTLSETEYCALFDTVAKALEEEFEREVSAGEAPAGGWADAFALLVERSLDRDGLRRFNEQHPEAAKRCHARFAGRMAGLMVRGIRHAQRVAREREEAQSRTRGPLDGWDDDIEAGMSRAQRRGKGLAIYFRADGSFACQVLEKEAFSDRSLMDKLRDGHELVWMDLTEGFSDDLEVQRRYGVVGFPTLVVLDAKGREVARIEEALSAREIGRLIEGR